MKKREEAAIRRLRAEFLPEALELVERPASPLGNAVIWTVFLLLLLFLLWACIGQIDEVASARGYVSSEQGVQQVQAAGAGIITEVCVAEGDTVHKGDVLYRLDKEVEAANLSFSEGEIGLLQLRIELLGRLIDGKDILTYQDRVTDAAQKEVVAYMISMEEADRLSIAEYEAAVTSAQSQYAVEQLELSNIEEQQKYLSEEKDLQEDGQELTDVAELELALLQSNYEYAMAEAEKYKKLYEAGAISKSEWQAKQKEADNLEAQIAIKQAQIEGETLSASGEENNLNYQITQNQGAYEAQKKKAALAKNSYDTAVLNLENAKTEIKAKRMELKTQYTEQLKTYGVTVAEQTYNYENKEIVSLYDGVIKAQYVDKPGAVVAATQVVAEMLPDTSQYVIEAEVKNSDIGFVELGQKVDVKIDTYDYQKYGILTGIVTYISPDAIENERQERIYKVQVMLEETDLEGTQLALSQGMECSVEIKTGRRRIIAFFLEPLTEALDNSMHVR